MFGKNMFGLEIKIKSVTICAEQTGKDRYGQNCFSGIFLKSDRGYRQLAGHSQTPIFKTAKQLRAFVKKNFDF